MFRKMSVFSPIFVSWQWNILLKSVYYSVWGLCMSEPHAYVGISLLLKSHPLDVCSYPRKMISENIQAGLIGITEVYQQNFPILSLSLGMGLSLNDSGKSICFSTEQTFHKQLKSRLGSISLMFTLCWFELFLFFRGFGVWMFALTSLKQYFKLL